MSQLAQYFSQSYEQSRQSYVFLCKYFSTTYKTKLHYTNAQHVTWHVIVKDIASHDLLATHSPMTVPYTPLQKFNSNPNTQTKDNQYHAMPHPQTTPTCVDEADTKQDHIHTKKDSQSHL